MSQSIKNEKIALRKRIKVVLSKLEEKEIEEQSRLVTRKVLNLPAYENARAISIFLSMPGREISTTEIVVDALRKDKKVFIPYIHSSEDDPKMKTMDMLRLKDESDLRGLKPDPWGIPSLSVEDVEHRENAMGGSGISGSPLTSLVCSKLDLVFMPGMAFDQLKHRLGHGKGFYDRYISRLQQSDTDEIPASSRPTLVGLALREQLLAEGEEVPIDEYDRQIDQLIVAD